MLVICLVVIALLGQIGGTRHQRSKDFLDVEAYLKDVFKAFNQKVQDYGVVNLPVSDFTLSFNETKDGILLRGNVTYSSGIVNSIDTIVEYLRFLQTDLDDEKATISAAFEMPNISVTYLMDSKLEKHAFHGTSINVYPINRCEFSIVNDFVKNEVGLGYLETWDINAPKPIQDPENDITIALGKRAKLHFSTIFWDDVSSWLKDPFYSMLTSIVQSIEFPIQ
ncbi:uncharacterized protein [Anabrus simplex]|uniref:uncharacterized protein n=1 Tax=Anabrus simplex TaxID=316456 RepID=UPI0035A34629